MAEDVGGHAGAEVAFVVKLTGAASLTGDREVVGELERDFEVERQRHRQTVETRSEVGRTGGNAREHGFTVCVARAWARRPHVARRAAPASTDCGPRST